MTERGEQSNTNTLVIDTSYGSTVGIVGREPITETDSRTHVERLQANIARAVAEAGLKPADLDEIIVGTGPAPFTGLRAGVVAAKALAFATGATLIGHDVLSAQAQWNLIRRSEAGTLGDAVDGGRHVLTLAVNDARRKQLYFQLEQASLTSKRPVQALIAMDIDYPENIVERVNAAVRAFAEEHPGAQVVVDVIGHGAAKYASVFERMEHLGDISDESVLDQGAQGLSIFWEDAVLAHGLRPDAPVEPLYLRRPDAEIPNPLKHVLGHAGADKA
ncbi:tRNA (adenosine(37)-N6)-threonylcarbamoyltransferase complex dimerization subunit type 1 TsaB [Bifidobacterium eulemuris]|uniref:tRNA (Adenosine(37)-N6)-threonylcarbamoyltransferase complex dimerization subunit type 1 TsaB n=1 Tax=Bifidobacterium eulemuris TaxID=1765219 RepID=A0A261GCC3_9BIFI|nr:tRNA (adenosine(37)-N6)-threonylcarbamoyltransferase complex dimerization subunit type 1 TsaB [Bifidobacterium eulemuris]OZG69089.1 tRNA threonylcarbamoyladenosine biosynthesis protein TsaB [Bifidobacterium eulemuris]QOL31389.1 tRNA (adenosine(37)-N6)-threonylcarbamoyltransferase complex dimerization subunit type 1 TsaB [Bifidobacterium eulemuris]